MDQPDVAQIAAVIHDILTNSDPDDRRARVREYLESIGAAGDWTSIQDLIVNAKTAPTVEQIRCTLKYIFCQPLTPSERANVIGANGLHMGLDSPGRRKVGGTTKPSRKRAKGGR
jgi:hypothetical protein